MNIDSKANLYYIKIKDFSDELGYFFPKWLSLDEIDTADIPQYISIIEDVEEPMSIFSELMLKMFPRIQRGDIIIVEEFHENNLEDENGGLYIFDGDNIIPLEHDIAQGSMIPEQFKVISEFPIQYWSNIIVGYPFVWIDLDIINMYRVKTIKGLEFPISSTFGDGYFVLKFEYDGNTYYIIDHMYNVKRETSIEAFKNSIFVYEYTGIFMYMDAENLYDLGLPQQLNIYNTLYLPGFTVGGE